jgi:hypothetical protein
MNVCMYICGHLKFMCGGIVGLSVQLHLPANSLGISSRKFYSRVC